MRALVLAVMFITVTTAANAFCQRKTQLMSDFSDTIANEFEYLICLHNEQVNSLNQHSNLLGTHTEAIIEIQDRQHRIAQALTEISNLVDIAIKENSAFERRLDDLERRLHSLE